jgi:glycosyltransferase involved in cell wall biosynthesis
MPLPVHPGPPRILVVYSRLFPNGGAPGVAAWILEALRVRYEVTVLTAEPVDFSLLDRFYGTSLAESRIPIRTISAPVRRLLELDPDPGSIQVHMYLLRMCKRLRHRYDLVIGADNEGDFGSPALQYIHWPYLSHIYPRVRASCDVPLLSKLACLHRGEIRPWMLVGGYSFDRMKANRTLVNSAWTGRWVKRVYGIDSTVVHPPAPGVFPDVPWEAREDGFVMMGRFCGGKQFDRCIEILRRVRSVYPQVRMHIVGKAYREAPKYPELLRALIRANSSWVTLHEDISRSELAALAARQRYGIHALMDEHFGMAVAEMIRAGCIPFVHNSGGPPETVGEDSRLIYDSEEDAARKIIKLMGNPAAQQELRQRFAARKDLHSPDFFMNAIRTEVEQQLMLTGRE